MTEQKEKEVYDNSLGVRASYGTRELFGQWVSSAFFLLLKILKKII